MRELLVEEVEEIAGGDSWVTIGDPPPPRIPVHPGITNPVTVF